MTKKILRLIVLIFILLQSNFAFGEGVDTIIIIVDQLSMKTVEELSLEKYSLGFVNLKTRPPYTQEGLYLSINAGRKLNIKDIGKKDIRTEYLGDILAKEKVSYIGEGKGNLILGNREGKVDYSRDTILYDYHWLIENTEELLEQSGILALEYNIQEDIHRIEILEQYLNHNKKNQIIVIPKAVAEEDRYFLNKYLVPIIYMHEDSSGLLTSSSTKREGFISLEDISSQIKDVYGYTKKVDIGKPFKVIAWEKPLDEFKNIYRENISLLITAYIFHGITYLGQIVLGIWILKLKKIDRRIYKYYVFIAINICMSTLLGLINIQSNIYIYLPVGILLSYLATDFIIKRKVNIIAVIGILTYGSIVLGTLIYPEMIYSSYMGFNNLVYGARYYGLNNGIMGVLLVTSILTFFKIDKIKEGYLLSKILGLFIFIINIIVLSTYFGANTGGFITSVVLFGLMIHHLFLSQKRTIGRGVIFALVGIIIFSINMLLDNFNGQSTHALNFFYRLKENGFMEFVSLVSFKGLELFKLTIMPPFSIVLIFQGMILNRFRKEIGNNRALKREARIIIITSLVGFILNDTGTITLIYMMHYLILNIMDRGISEGFIHLDGA